MLILRWRNEKKSLKYKGESEIPRDSDSNNNSK
jgi:hypothetical protein